MPVAGNDVDDQVIPGLSWGKRMELEDQLKDLAGNITSKKPGGDQVPLTLVPAPTEEFLCKAFTSVTKCADSSDNSTSSQIHSILLSLI